jgi:hypothetical protein
MCQKSDFPRTVLEHLRRGAWLTRDRIVAYGRIFLCLELALFAFCVAGTHGLVVPLKRPTSSDFVSFYAAGHLANSWTPWQAYDPIAHHAAEQVAAGAAIGHNFFFYPPVFLLVCGLLARLPYLTAFITFQVATLIPCLLVVRRIVPQAPATTLLAFPAVFWTMGTGQNAFLTAALFAGGTMLLERRPVLSGLLFGAICYKPDLGLLIPLALAAGRHWRCFAAAACASIGLVLVSVAAFGWQTWVAFLQQAAVSHTVYGTGLVDLPGFTSPFGVLLVLGQPRWIAELVQLAVTVGMGVLVWRVWRGGGSLALRAGVLLAATPLAVPVLMFYDLMLTGVAMAWLVGSRYVHGFAAGEKLALSVLFVLPLLSGNLPFTANLFLAPLTAVLGCLLVGTAAWRQLAGRRAGAGLAGTVQPALRAG